MLNIPCKIYFSHAYFKKMVVVLFCFFLLWLEISNALNDICQNRPFTWRQLTRHFFTFNTIPQCISCSSKGYQRAMRFCFEFPRALAKPFKITMRVSQLDVHSKSATTIFFFSVNDFFRMT